MNAEDDRTGTGIEYHGGPGVTQLCLDAIMRLIQFGDQITKVQILSSPRTHVTEHCLILTVNVGDLIAVKSGFASGYMGEGSAGFSYALALLEAHGAEIEEYEVTSEIIERCDNSALTRLDLEFIEAARPIRPSRWYDYVFEKHWDPEKNERLWSEFPPVIPFAIIDGRIIDLAKSFWENPNDKLLTGYRRLEVIVRERTGINEHGTKLLAQAFASSESKLRWKDLDKSEQAGRAQLFIGTFMAYRNPRAHREVEDYRTGQLAEFLLLNHLYCLEREAIEATVGDDVPSDSVTPVSN